LSRRRFCLRRCAAAAFVVVPPLPSLSRHWFFLRHCAAAAFVIALPTVLHSLSRRRRFCVCHRAATAFIVELPLPSLLRRHCLLCCATVEWWNGGMGEWQNGGMAEWGMAE
jgi:hypothetical protein